jgi:hypothetical protein
MRKILPHDSHSRPSHFLNWIDHLQRAIGASDRFRASAREDSDFDSIRDEPSFKALIG